MNNQWFRMYGDVINDPKVMRLAEATRWHWVAMLCVASKNGGAIPPAAELAFLLRMSEQRAALIVTELTVAGLLDRVEGGFAPHNWNGRQYKSDSSTERVKRFRERKGNVLGNVSADVTETAPEQSRTETEQNRARELSKMGLSEKVLRSDLLEIFEGADVDLSRAGVWLEKGYAPSMVCEVVRELRARKPGIASLAYFDAALAERHARRELTPSERAAAPIDLDKVVLLYAQTGVWSKYAGPEPGLSGCRIPPALLAKHGLDASGQKIRQVG